MNNKLIPFLFLSLFAFSGAALASGPAPGKAATEPSGAKAAQVEQADPEKEYARLLAAYQKDRTAYEADPTIWTTAIPEPPVKPRVGAQAQVRR